MPTPVGDVQVLDNRRLADLVDEAKDRAAVSDFPESYRDPQYEPWVVSSIRSLSMDRAGVSGSNSSTLHLNPNRVTYGYTTREAFQNVAGGRVRHVWVDPRTNRPASDATFSYSFQGGSMMPVDVPTDATTDDIVQSIRRFVPPGLASYYRYCALLMEPPLTGAGNDNLHMIASNDPAYPALTVLGWFEGSLSVTLSTDNPWVLEWDVQMTVTSTIPSYDAYEELLSRFVSAP